jgi:hypothetical protein
MNPILLYTCACCGYKIKRTEYYGSYEVCPICYWEDDQLQFEDPNMEGGANPMSLRQAQRNFRECGACEMTMKQYVVKDRSQYELDKNWKPLDE